MRPAALLLLLLACSAPPRGGVETMLDRAAEAGDRSDWESARRALEQASLAAPTDLRLALALADVSLVAFGDIERAEQIYFALPREAHARRLHGLGRCALWRGDEPRALALFRASLRVRPTTGCARDLALRLLGRGEPADDALDRVEELSGATLRSRLLLAAAGRRPPPGRLPEGWRYALERARLAPPAEASREVDLYVSSAGANGTARSLLRAVLAGDPAVARNLPIPGGVKGES